MRPGLGVNAQSGDAGLGTGPLQLNVGEVLSLGFVSSNGPGQISAAVTEQLALIDSSSALQTVLASLQEAIVLLDAKSDAINLDLSVVESLFFDTIQSRTGSNSFNVSLDETMSLTVTQTGVVAGAVGLVITGDLEIVDPGARLILTSLRTN